MAANKASIGTKSSTQTSTATTKPTREPTLCRAGAASSTTIQASPNSTPPASHAACSSSPATNSPATISPTPDDPSLDADEESGLYRLLKRIRKLKAKTVLESTGVIFAIFGVVWALYVSLPSWKLQRWSASNDFLQACLSMETPSVRSLRCNESIEAGPAPPPRWKRELHSTVTAMVVHDPAIWTAAAGMTVAALIMATIYFRPRMEPFHPIVSMARLPVCGPLQPWRGSTAVQRYITTWTTHNDQQMSSDADQPILGPETKDFEDGSSGVELPHIHDEDTELDSDWDEGEAEEEGKSEIASGFGQRIGVWYFSDDDSDGSLASSADLTSGVVIDTLLGPARKIDRSMSCSASLGRDKVLGAGAPARPLVRVYSCPSNLLALMETGKQIVKVESDPNLASVARRIARSSGAPRERHSSTIQSTLVQDAAALQELPASTQGVGRPYKPMRAVWSQVSGKPKAAPTQIHRKPIRGLQRREEWHWRDFR